MFEKQAARLAAFNSLVTQAPHVDPQATVTDHLRVGVDLGTATIVFAVINDDGEPIYGEAVPDQAVRDGVVVHYGEAVTIVRAIKARAEAALGVTLTTAAGAIPPGVSESNSKAVANVIEDSGLTCTNIVDEPTAAATMLGVTDGTIVDVGGGTTGISVFKNDTLKRVGDEPTGGYHMTLVVAGSQHLDHAAAEVLKRDRKREDDVFAVVRPVVEKMAAIVANVAGNQLVEPVIAVGGATNFREFAPTMAKTLGVPVLALAYPDFVTPLGIALSDLGVAAEASR
ncbi:ethanolamine utilization protein EutJ [Furfurilactobacillus sp. WILCCON 0119]|uniref:ethanolamine utilization protein EutJ n=1 Tax=Furfurilactobacillus entadae TaxID=2922307 RepID=UPI0035E78C93